MQDTYPVLIASRDRLSPLRELVSWLERCGQAEIVIVDMMSTYPPLLDWLATCSHRVEHLKQDIRPQGFFEAGIVDKYCKGRYFALTDPDVVPDETCPLDALSFFEDLLNRYPKRRKAGFGLRLDDIPASFEHRDFLIRGEGVYWQREVEPGVYDANIDTTFALYRPTIDHHVERFCLRTGPPYVARHLPWYRGRAEWTDEDAFYNERSSITTWGHGEAPVELVDRQGPSILTRGVWAAARTKRRLLRQRVWDD